MVSEESNARDELVRLVRLVTAEGMKIMEAFADQQKLHQTDVEALSLLMVADAQHKPLTVGALGRELGLTSGATTFMVGRLERALLIERVRDQNDHRKTFLHFTETGRRLAEEFFSPVHRLSNAVMNNFSPGELMIVREFLRETTAAMAAHRNTLLRFK